ncbi:hypothetical protein [Ruegeria sp.]|uniref:hypothetical protein n=1 Tax=Ruegeria sp. TaxID=1879320 RepID=UPI003B001089
MKASKPRRHARRRAKPGPGPKPAGQHQSPDIAACAARLGLAAVRLEPDGWFVLARVTGAQGAAYAWRPASPPEMQLFEAGAGARLVAGHWSLRQRGPGKTPDPPSGPGGPGSRSAG